MFAGLKIGLCKRWPLRSWRKRVAKATLAHTKASPTPRRRPGLDFDFSLPHTVTHSVSKSDLCGPQYFCCSKCTNASWTSAGTRWNMASWLVTCSIVLTVILSTLIVGAAVTCVVRKIWKSGNLVLVIPELVPELDQPKATWPPPVQTPVIWAPPIPPALPESPLSPPLYTLCTPIFCPGDPEPPIQRPCGPFNHLPGRRSPSRLGRLSLSAPDLCQVQPKLGMPIRPIDTLQPELFLPCLPRCIILPVPAVRPVEPARPLLQPHQPAETQSATILPPSSSSRERTPTVPLTGLPPRDSGRQQHFRHAGQRQPHMLFALPHLVPNIPTSARVVIPQLAWVYRNPGVPRVGRPTLQLQGPDSPVTQRAPGLLRETERAPVLPRPSPNPPQGGLYQPQLRLLPQDPLPQDLAPRREACTLHFQPIPEAIPEPPMTVVILPPPDTLQPYIPCEPPPCHPRSPRCLPEWSLPQLQAPMWPMSPTPLQPAATERAPRLPDRAKVAIPKIMFRPKLPNTTWLDMPRLPKTCQSTCQCPTSPVNRRQMSALGGSSLRKGKPKRNRRVPRQGPVTAQDSSDSRTGSELTGGPWIP